LKWWLAVAIATIAACKPLPSLDEGVCGNHVIEPGEDCDGFADEREICFPPEAANACHYGCTVDAVGEPVECPEGYGCYQGICRKPTLAFVGGEEPAIPGAVESLLSGDFNGDDRRDVLALEAPRAFGLSKPSLHFFDELARPTASWSTSREIASPNVANVTRDKHDDLVSTMGALMVMQGESNDTLTPLPRTSYYLENSRIKTIPAANFPIADDTPILLLRQSDEGLALVRPELTQQLVILARPEGNLGDLIGEPVVGDVFENDERFPCFDVSFALRGSPSLSLFQPCERDPENGRVVWRDEAIVTTLTFDPPSTPLGAPIFADLDGDGHQDVLCNAERGLYVAFGDGDELGPLEPLQLLRHDDDEQDEIGPKPILEAPLAAGDFSGDGLADLVLPQSVAISVESEDGIFYQPVFDAVGRPWTIALVADLNADGKLDAAAASAEHPDIDFFAGTGRGGPNPFLISTIRPVTRITVGDFDGDQINDLAFVEPDRVPTSGETTTDPTPEDQMSVAFGSPHGAPLAPVPIAHLADVTGLTGLADGLENSRSDLMVVQDVCPTVVSEPGTLAEASTCTGEKYSSLSLIFANGDRTFYAPAVVTNFAVDGTLEGADVAVYVTTGTFAGENRLDVVLLGETEDDDGSLEYSFWYLPEVESPQTAMRRLPLPFVLPFDPLRTSTGDAAATLRMHAADMGGDSTQELVIAGPSADRTACLVQVSKYDADEDHFVPTNALTIADGCSDRPRIETGDFDADGSMDLAILTGSIDNGGHIRVLWNDGTGSLAEAGSGLPFFADSEGPIRAFDFFRETDKGPFRLAYATADSAYIVPMQPRTRQLQPFGTDRTGIQSVPLHGDPTSLLAEDFSGDGVTDLVVADGGDVYVFRARLESQ
jgi:hypothetical protein